MNFTALYNVFVSLALLVFAFLMRDGHADYSGFSLAIVAALWLPNGLTERLSGLLILLRGKIGPAVALVLLGSCAAAAIIAANRSAQTAEDAGKAEVAFFYRWYAQETTWLHSNNPQILPTFRAAAQQQPIVAIEAWRTCLDSAVGAMGTESAANETAQAKRAQGCTDTLTEALRGFEAAHGLRFDGASDGGAGQDLLHPGPGHADLLGNLALVRLAGWQPIGLEPGEAQDLSPDADRATGHLRLTPDAIPISVLDPVGVLPRKAAGNRAKTHPLCESMAQRIPAPIRGLARVAVEPVVLVVHVVPLVGEHRVRCLGAALKCAQFPLRHRVRCLVNPRHFGTVAGQVSRREAIDRVHPSLLSGERRRHLVRGQVAVHVLCLRREVRDGETPYDLRNNAVHAHTLHVTVGPVSRRAQQDHLVPVGRCPLPVTEAYLVQVLKDVQPVGHLTHARLGSVRQRQTGGLDPEVVRHENNLTALALACKCFMSISTLDGRST